MTQFDEENVWALATDHANNLLIAGDTAGFVSVFDITSWCCNNSTVSALCACVHVCDVL